MGLLAQAWRNGWSLAHERQQQPMGLLGQQKRADYTHRPPGALLWLLMLITPAVVEVVALLIGRTDYTLSRSLWWALGPPYEPRWWLLGMPLGALLLWVWPHFMWPHRWDGVTLLAMVIVFFIVGALAATLGVGRP